MTWEVDIVQRAGRFSVVGQFKINDAREATSFMNALNDHFARIGIKVVQQNENKPALVNLPGHPKKERT